MRRVSLLVALDLILQMFPVVRPSRSRASFTSSGVMSSSTPRRTQEKVGGLAAAVRAGAVLLVEMARGWPTWWASACSFSLRSPQGDEIAAEPLEYTTTLDTNRPGIFLNSCSRALGDCMLRGNPETKNVLKTGELVEEVDDVDEDEAVELRRRLGGTSIQGLGWGGGVNWLVEGVGLGWSSGGWRKGGG